jgi:membrane protein EpsK
VTEAENREFSKYLVPNMVTNIIRTLLTALVGLMLIPFFIDELGRGAYAILPLATSVTLYVIVITDELTNAFSRSLIIALHGKDAVEMNKAYSTTVLGLARIVLLMVPLVVMISVISPYVFQIGASSAQSVQLLFLMSLSSALLFSFTACFNGIFTAYNKMYILYTARIAHTLMQVALILVLFFANGPSLEMVGLAYFVSSVVFFLLVFITSKRLCPSLRIERRHFDRPLLRTMSNLGMWTITARLGFLLFIQASLVIVNLFFGVEEEAGFAIIANLLTITNTACLTITTVVIPFMYRSYAAGDMENVKRISKMSMRVIGLFIAFPIAYLCTFSPQILTVWVGGEFSYLSEMIMVMFIVQLAVCVISVIETIPVILVKMRPIALLTLAIGAANIAVAVFVAVLADLGTFGTAVIWTASMFVLNVVMYPLMIAKMTSSPRTTFLRPMVPGYIAFFVCLSIGYVSTRFFTLPTTWTAIIGLFIVTYAVYALLALVLGLKREDKEMIRGVLPGSIARLIPKKLL